jgi:outer membrane protein insertion porin family
LEFDRFSRLGQRAGTHSELAVPRVSRELWLAIALLALLVPVASRAAEVRLAVLSVRVESAKPIAYLGDSLANLVRARLSERSELEVLSAGEVGARLGERLSADPSDETLREWAQQLGLTAWVTGQLTELSGRYELALRVVPASAGSPEQSVAGTAESEEQLLDRVGELTSEIAERALALAAPPAPARSEPSAAPEPARSAAAPVSDPGRVREIRIQGNRRIDTEAIRLRIGTKVGDRFDRAQLTADLEAIHELGFFRDVRVFAEPSEAGVRVRFEVEEAPIVKEISISGNENIDSDKIKDILTLTTGSTLDLPLVHENRQRIQQLYRAEGYYLANVESKLEPVSEAATAVQFVVDEGEKLKLREIAFNGNEFFDAGELTSGFQTKRWRFWSYLTSWFDRSGTYSEPLFLQDLRSVEKKYTDAGFLQVELGEPIVKPSEDGLAVTVPVTEGRRFKVGALEIEGDESVDEQVLREKLELETGEWLNRSALTKDVETLTDHYRDRGFYFASVSPLTNLGGSSDAVDVAFQVKKGPLYFIRQVDIEGNDTTVDPVIRREVPLAEGQLYSQRQINLAKRRIQGLGFFEEVDLKPEPTEEAEQLDLSVKVVERPTGSFSFGAGFSSQDRFVINGSLSQQNLFGRGWATNLSADVGGRTQRFLVSLQDPSIFDSDWGLGVTAFRTSLRFQDFKQDATGGDLFLSHALSEDGRTRGAVRYSFQDRNIDDDSGLNEAAGIIQRELVAGSLTASSIGLEFTRDLRDDRIAASEGYVVGGSVEFAGLGFDARFLRFEGRGAWFLGAPSWLFDHSSFVLSSRIGYVMPFNSIADFDLPQPDTGVDDLNGQLLALDQIDTDQKLPLSERYFLGGIGSFQLRGFKSRSVGPRRAILSAPNVLGGAIGATTNTFIPIGHVLIPATDAEGRFVDVDGDGNNDFFSVCDRDGDALQDAVDTCNKQGARDIDDFANLSETDVIGGNKFISTSFEYRFPISETVGLQGVIFVDLGNAFAEGDNLFAVKDWRYGTGAGVQWFSPFGPLMFVLGFPLDPLSIEKSPEFEFSVGGGSF